MKDKLIIAHRGDVSRAVENTLEAFQSAAQHGADMVEVDVRETKDGVLIVHHNRTIKGKFIRKMDWSDIEKINSQRNFSIPKLEDVIKFAQGKIKLDIDLKEEGYEEAVLELLEKYLGYNDFILTSFSDRTIDKIKRISPRARTGLLLSLHMPGSISFSKRGGLLSAKRYRLSHADFFLPHTSLVKMGFLKTLKKFNKPIIVWISNKKEAMEKLLQDKMIHGIITDKLKKALNVRKDLMQSYE